jgi:hypothetical protein
MRASLIALALICAPVIGASWYCLGTWNGDGAKQTPSFTTTQREWRVRWTVKAADPKFANLSRFNGTVMDDRTRP